MCLIRVPHPVTVVFKVWSNFTSVKRYMAANVEPQQWGVAEPYGNKMHGNSRVGLNNGGGGCHRKWAKIFDFLSKNIRM